MCRHCIGIKSDHLAADQAIPSQKSAIKGHLLWPNG